MQVEPLHANSVVALAKCHIDCWRESYQGLVADHILDAFDVDQRAQQWERHRAAGLSRIYVAFDGAAADDLKIAGFAAASPGNPTELDAIYVRMEFHGSGLADELIAAVVDDEPARLWVFEQNPRAQRFYRRHGFTADQVSRIEPFTGLTEIRMSR